VAYAGGHRLTAPPRRRTRHRRDAAVGDGEREGHPRLAADRPDHARRTVDQRELCGPGPAGERLGHRVRAANERCRADLDTGGVRPQDNLGIEQREQTGEVATARGRQEGVHDGLAACGVTAVDRLAVRGALRLPAGPAGQLAGRGW
jgi:hypothetical protein